MTNGSDELDVRRCFKTAGKAYLERQFVDPCGVVTVAPLTVTPEKKSAVYAYVRDGNEILLVQKRDRAVWELPGGGIGASENRFEGVSRQWKEEIARPNLNASPLESDFPFESPQNAYSHEVNYTRGGKYMIYNQTFLSYPAPASLKEHPLLKHQEWDTREGKARWFDINKLPPVDMTHWLAIKSFTSELRNRLFAKPAEPAYVR